MALGTLIRVTETDDVASAYAATYPIALVMVVLASPFIGISLHYLQGWRSHSNIQCTKAESLCSHKSSIEQKYKISSFRQQLELL